MTAEDRKPIMTLAAGSVTLESEKCENESELLLNLQASRNVLFPIQYQDVSTNRSKMQHINISQMWQMYKKAEASFWVAEEIDLRKDSTDWRFFLNNTEKAFISRIIALFTSSDGLVNNTITHQLLLEVTIPEARYFYGLQVMKSVNSQHYTLTVLIVPFKGETYIRKYILCY